MKTEQLLKSMAEYLAVIESLYKRWGRPEMSFLDLGCGDGNYAQFHARFFKNVELADVQDRRVNGRLYQFHTVDLNGTLDLPKQYDFVTCLEVIEHLDDLEGGIKNLKKAVKKGGFLLISTPNRCRLAESVKNCLGMATRFPTPGNCAERHYREFNLEELRALFAGKMEILFDTIALNRISSYNLPFSLPQHLRQHLIMLLRN